MRKVWIVTANSSQAKIYHAENVQKLIECKDIKHTEGHLNSKELTADRQGRTTRRQSYGTDTLEEKTSPKMKESSLFAEEIAHILKEGYEQGSYERLYLVATPSFLGYLRKSITPPIAKLIYSEIHKDLTHKKPEEIRSYLPPVL